MTIIETAKMNGRTPQAYMADILDRINDHKINRLDELLPWNGPPKSSPQEQAAAYGGTVDLLVCTIVLCRGKLGEDLENDRGYLR